ncbi:MAG: hypothetical protein U9O94_01970, partial [Nanoarchaeota archaeon]|nr:hypothetical protein [Nanoarchaeota archaeon]
FGFRVTDSNGQELEVPDGFDLSRKEDREGNPEMDIVIARPYFFKPDSQFNVIHALAEGKNTALKAWKDYRADLVKSQQKDDGKR